MITNNTDQNNQQCFPDLYSPNDPDLILIAKYSVFRSITLRLINDFFKEVKTYGSISGIPSDSLFLLQKKFESTICYFHDLGDRLFSSLDKTTSKIENLSEEIGSDSLIYWLYSKKRLRLIHKLEYCDNIQYLKEYIKFFCMRKAI